MPLNQPRTEQDMLTGVSCQGGSVTAEVCIVSSLREISKFKPGRVLVTKYLNPAWISIFPAVSAIIAEEGGILSHGAVVAREMCIPTILQANDAMSKLQNNELIYIDADNRVITRASNV